MFILSQVGEAKARYDLNSKFSLQPGGRSDMKRTLKCVLTKILLTIGVLFVLMMGSRQSIPPLAQETPSANPDREAQIMEFLGELEAYGRGKGYYNISPVDGRFLKSLVAMSDAQRALEIGSANGYSAIWMGMGLEETGGKLITIEIDAKKAAEARENLKRIGMEGIVTVINADAFEAIPRLEGSFDFVFLDAWKSDYYAFYKLIMPMLEEGGLLVADNAILYADSMRDFLDAVTTDPRLDTSIVELDGNDGFAICYRKKGR